MPTLYKTIRHDIRDGDVALWPGGSIVGRLDHFSHASRLLWYGNTLAAVEFREFKRARVLPFSELLAEYPGSPSIVRPQSTPKQAHFAAELMFRQANKKYGWWSIARQVWQRANLLRFITGIGFDEHDMTPAVWDAPKDCSEAIVWSDRLAMGKVNSKRWPCQGRADWACSPQNVADDAAFYKLIHSDVVLV